MLDSNLLILFAKLSVTFGVGGVKLADALKDIGAQLFNLIVKLITKIRIATIKRPFSRTHLACLRRAQCKSPLTNKESQALLEDFQKRKDQIDIDLHALTASSPHIVKGLFFNAFLYAASVFGFNPAVNLVNNLD